ncbi:Large-conductance mechanosensitive channel [Cytospora mali]|uniref:large conductance mechanosensitive channel protein MscL n=1 Tax=Candidatus Phytoplasma tritici TaxID=321961 RepID=UPI000424B546|nr:large conductance mechanosensitive channel protein MscL [Candidatus Phytoplasma tritici]KUI63409.1 Large-conductance mechanosensitive channel [Valsa mali]
MIENYNFTSKSLQFAKGFKTFIARGNVINLAVAVLIGQLFAKILSSLVADIIMPLFSLLFDYTGALKDLKFEIKTNTYLGYGNFLQTILEFLLLSFIIYTILNLMSWKNPLQKDKTDKNMLFLQENLNKEIALLEEIKDILKSNK